MKKSGTLVNFILVWTLLQTSAGAVAELDLDAGAKAIQNAVIIDTQASAILVNGARRYIDWEDPQEKPAVINGSIYLPVHTLARALGYYYEAEPQQGYYLLRKENLEICIDGRNAYRQVGRGNLEEIENPMLYRNGEAILPIRRMAEAAGMTAAYQDGLAVLTDQAPESILNDSDAMGHIRAELSDFRETPPAGRTYFVAQTENADDSNPGTEALPFRTLSRAGQAAGPGDRVVVRAGIYRETFRPANSGTATAPVIYEAYPDETVVISAAELVTGFQPAENGMVKARLPADLGVGRNQVFYQGEALAEGRYPNGPGLEMSADGEALSSLFPTAGDFQVSAQNRLRIESGTLLQESAGWWDGAIYVGMQGTGWVLSTGLVEKSEPGALTIATDLNIYDPTIKKNRERHWWFGWEEGQRESYGFLTGHIHCVDVPGEWAVQNGELYILPPNGETAQSLAVEAKARQLAVDLGGKRYIQLRGIDTFGGGIRMQDSTMCVINDGEMRYISHYIHGYDQREGYIDDGNVLNENGAPPRGEMGIYISGSNNAIINSVIDHSAAAGVYSTGTYLYLENNVIKNCGYAGGYVSGITFGTEGWKEQTTPRGGMSMYHNTVYNCGRSALNMQGRQYWENSSDTPYLPFEAAYNDFHDGILFSLDTGIVYEYYVHAGSQSRNSSFHNNYVYYTRPKSNPYSFGIYHDGNTSGIDTYENLVFTTQPGVRFSNGNIYKQPEADCAVWNNMELRNDVEGGRAGLLATDFPGGKPYFAGAYLRTADYQTYCEQFMEEPWTAPYYRAADGVVNNGSVDENGLARLNTGGWIRWDQVDFGQGGNRLDISFRGNPQRTGDQISVVVGEDLETGKRYNAVLQATAPDQETDNLVSVDTQAFTGMQTVYLRMDRKVSSQIAGFSVTNRGTEKGAHDGGAVYGGAYDNIEKIGNPAFIPTPIYGANGDLIHPMVKNTYGGTVLRYDNVTIREDAAKLTITAASAASSSGGTVEIRLGAADAEPVAVYTIQDTGWDTYLADTVALIRTVNAGTYDVYVTFQGAGKTSNFYTFGFLAE